MKMSLKSLALATVFSCIGTTASVAVEVTYDCTFPRASTIKQAGADAGNFKRVYLFDNNEGDAQLVENGEPTQRILILRGIDGISFIQIDPRGAAQVTTVATSNTAVHSRHNVAGGTDVLAVQYYGSCEQK